MRYVLAALETGFQEVRFHLSGGSYDPFLVRGTSVIDRPLESALVALNQWLPPGASIRTIPRVRGLLATAIDPAPGAAPSASVPQLVLDNESAKPQTVLLRGTSAVQIALLSAVRSGLQTAQIAAAGGHISLTVPANSVLAILGTGAAAV